MPVSRGAMFLSNADYQIVDLIDGEAILQNRGTGEMFRARLVVNLNNQAVMVEPVGPYAKVPE